MAKRRAKRTVKRAVSSPEIQEDGIEGVNEPKLQKLEEAPFAIQEVGRRSAAIRAIRDVEIEHLLTELRLLRSYFNKEQLETPLMQFFRENLPNILVVNDEKNKQLEVQWNDKEGGFPMNQTDGINIHAALLHRLSIVHPEFSGAIPPFNGFEFSSKSVKTRVFGSDNLHIRAFDLEEPSDTHTIGMQEALRTPGVNSQRLSMGMTPKTIRQPKPGEMLLSVHGSPLGVYKEDNMEAIHESEEG